MVPIGDCLAYGRLMWNQRCEYRQQAPVVVARYPVLGPGMQALDNRHPVGDFV
jgi:hypothetical protein